MNKILGLSFLVILLAGCGETSEPTYDEEYYKTHETERLAKLDWCKGNAERKQTFNCQNAIAAASDIKVGIMFGEGFPRTK